MGPIDYTLPRPDLMGSLKSGLELGLTLRAIQDKRAQAEQEAAAQAQYQADLQGAMTNPTAEAFAGLAVKYPKHREAYQQAWEGLSTERQQNELRDASELAAALQGGRPDVALSRLDERIKTMEASGSDTKRLKFLRDQVETNPQQALGSVLAVVSGVPGGDKLLSNLAALGTEQRAAAKAPIELRQAEATATSAEAAAKVAPVVQQATAEKAAADARTAGVTAKYAESKAVADLEKAGWDVKALQADVEFKKQSARIAAMNASLAKEGNNIRRQELRMKIDDAVAARETKVREKVGEAESGAAAIDNMLNTIERIEANPSLRSVIGSMEGKAYYPNATLGTLNPFGDGDQRADAIRLIETLGSQAFLAQIPNIKGLGALSNPEGEKLQAAFQNLSRDQSEEQFKATMQESRRLLLKGRAELARKTGVPLGKPDTPAKPTAPAGGVTVSGW